MAAYSASNIVVTVSEVTTTNANGQAAIIGSNSLNSTARAVGQSVMLPSGPQTLPAGSSLIGGEGI